MAQFNCPPVALLGLYVHENVGVPERSRYVPDAGVPSVGAFGGPSEISVNGVAYAPFPLASWLAHDQVNVPATSGSVFHWAAVIVTEPAEDETHVCVVVHAEPVQ
jgi:hypothetical protein